VYHHYDYTYHWYGFWVGDAMFWTRYYDGRFWSYDPYWHRWVYFHDNNWWWQDPYNVNVIYIYRDNYYYHYQSSPGGTLIVPDYTPAPYTPPAGYVPDPVTPVTPVTPAPEAPLPGDTYYYSLDGTRSIQVSGERATAVLFDLTAEDVDGLPKYLSYLGVGVDEVRFQNDADGKVQNILTLWEDQAGTKQFSLFDANGVALTGPAPVAAPAGSFAITPVEPIPAPRAIEQLERMADPKRADQR